MKTPDGKDMNVPSRTPEEIKKWLNGCTNKENCGWCPNSFMCEGDKVVLAYIQQLEAERDKYKRERDAAVEDMRHDPHCCYHCKHRKGKSCQSEAENDGDCFEWRGVEEE